MIYEMAEEIAKKKRKKIENLIEDYINKNGKDFKDDAKGILADTKGGSKQLSTLC